MKGIKTLLLLIWYFKWAYAFWAIIAVTISFGLKIIFGIDSFLVSGLISGAIMWHLAKDNRV